MDTSAFTVGNSVFVNGATLTETPPFDAGHYLAHIGFVTTSHPTQGAIDVFMYVQPATAGPTTARPVAGSFRVGGYWFDTTLGIPIWWDGSDWVNASGASV